MSKNSKAYDQEFKENVINYALEHPEEKYTALGNIEKIVNIHDKQIKNDKLIVKTFFIHNPFPNKNLLK